MPGMNNGLDPDDPTVVAAFRAALLHQGVIALLVFAVLSVAWVSVRAQPGGPRPWGQAGSAHPLARVRAGLWAYGEPAGRQVLRISFGVLWLADAVLLAQPGMAAGLPSQVIGPSAVTSPAWVQHVAGWAGNAWSYQPVEVSSAALWIEAGIGLWLLAAPRGTSSRLVLAAVHAVRPGRPLVAADPARHRDQRRPGPGRAGPADADHRDTPEPGPGFLPGHRDPGRRRQLVQPAARARVRGRPRRPRRGPRRPAPRPRPEPGRPGRSRAAGRLDRADHAAGPGRHGRGTALRAGQAHRGRLYPGRVAAAGRDLRPGRHGRGVRPPGRNLAAGRPGPARRAKRPASTGHPAEPVRRPRRGAAPGGHRSVGEPARRLDRRRPGLDAVPRLRAIRLACC
jgi:hypothetical protein